MQNQQAPGPGTGSPTRFEADIPDCEVQGQIPRDIDGAFYRVGAEWYYPPIFADDAILNADGYFSMFRIRDGRVSYKGRWVRTERFRYNQEAGRQLYGYYRNPYTDDPYIRDPANPARRTVANTAPLIHARRLLALKEDGLRRVTHISQIIRGRCCTRVNRGVSRYAGDRDCRSGGRHRTLR
jgi:carotenoid cleavage dioxygenase